MTFSSDLNRIVKKTNGKLDRILRFTAIAALDGVVMLSPVGNPTYWKSPYFPKGYSGGRFRGNWQLSINRPKTGVLDTKDKTGIPTISKGTATASQLKVGQSAYIVNNLPYAQALEYGHSQVWAPHGMVRITAQRLGRNIQNEARRLNRK